MSDVKALTAAPRTAPDYGIYTSESLHFARFPVP